MDLSKKTVVIAGCGKNIQPYIDDVFNNIYRIAGLFWDYKIVLFENDSTDKTLEMLSQRATIDPNITLIIEKDIPIPVHFHPSRIAYGRNKLLQKIDASFADYDYMIMMDLDDVCASPMNIDTFTTIFKNKEWDSVSFNRASYYDMWALRYPYFTKNCWNFPRQQSCDIYIRTHQHHVTTLLKKRSMLRVYSAFGGFAIYKMKKIKNCTYNGENKEQPAGNWSRHTQDCEHIAFHVDMIKKHHTQHFISSSILFAEYAGPSKTLAQGPPVSHNTQEEIVKDVPPVVEEIQIAEEDEKEEDNPEAKQSIWGEQYSAQRELEALLLNLRPDLDLNVIASRETTSSKEDVVIEVPAKKDDASQHSLNNIDTEQREKAALDAKKRRDADLERQNEEVERQRLARQTEQAAKLEKEKLIALEAENVARKKEEAEEEEEEARKRREEEEQLKVEETRLQNATTEKERRVEKRRQRRERRRKRKSGK